MFWFAVLCCLSLLIHGTAVFLPLFLLLRKCLAQYLSLKLGRKVFATDGFARALICGYAPHCKRLDCHACIHIFIKTKGATRDMILTALKRSHDLSPWPRKFRCYLQLFWGFSFWIQDPNFALEERVQNYAGTMEDSLNIPHFHPPDTANMWTFLICFDGVVLRVNHSLMDGISAAKFIAATVVEKTDEPLEIGPAPKGNPPFWMRFCSYLFQFVPNLTNQLRFDQNQWMTSHPRSGKVSYAATTQPFPVQRLKKIGAGFGRATVSEILTTAIVTSILSLTKDLGKSTTLSYCLPQAFYDNAEYKDIKVNHNLRNSSCGYRIWVSPPQDKINVFQVLWDTRKQFNKFKTDPLRFSLKYGISQCNNVPLPKFFFVMTNTAVISSVPGITRHCKIQGGNDIEAFQPHCHIPCNGPPLIFHFVNYAGSISLSLSADTEVLETVQRTADEILQLISENIDKLEELSRKMPAFIPEGDLFYDIPDNMNSDARNASPPPPRGPLLNVLRKTDVVISGMSGRFPESENIEAFARNLYEATDMVTEDSRRWPPGLFGLPTRSGKLPDIVSFDASFFAQAHHAISTGLCDSAVVAGVNLNLKPQYSLQFERLGMLSSDGKCKAFDSSGNGYVRSEAAAVVFLQRQPEARRIYASLIHAKTNTDGFKDQGVTYPSGEMQKNLLLEVYEEAGVQPQDVAYVEAHGTGTKVGDPQELNAITDVFCKGRNTPLLIGSVKSNVGHAEPASGMCQVVKTLLAMESGVGDPQELNAIADVFCKGRNTPLLIGSVKSNVGHAEPASGMCQVVKTLLAMESGVIPGNLHFKNANPNIPALSDGRLQV
ncbi:unnamed protein product [Cyprideis torosa]|uniref:Fatty acid synthase n=1 Tax=Cyprideis torosa TaxID=163714 RepID=A0A7R8WKB8_9CRUS|nr:unnamed protein product [Cyprideis torosa]CAG0900288.1 unnamed protein product [Cyprideis torosa]